MRRPPGSSLGSISDNVDLAHRLDGFPDADKPRLHYETVAGTVCDRGFPCLGDFDHSFKKVAELKRLALDG